MTKDEIVNGGSRKMPLPTAVAHQPPENDGDMVRVDRPRITGPRLSMRFLTVGVPLAAIFLIVRLLDAPKAIVGVYVAYLFLMLWREVQEAKKVCYIITKDGLEWIVPNIAGGANRIRAGWHDIVWIGPLPRERAALRTLNQKFKLSVGRVRSAPTIFFTTQGAKWRAIRRGERFHHAVDFYPSPQYLETLRKTAPASLIESAFHFYDQDAAEKIAQDEDGDLKHPTAPAALPRRHAASSSDVIYVDRPKTLGPTLPAFLLSVGVPVAGFYLAMRMLGFAPTFATYLYVYVSATVLREYQETRKSRYVISREGLEWIVPNIAGGTDRIVAKWDQIAWIGPFPEDRNALRALNQEYKLSIGRVRSVPATAYTNMEGEKWRVIRRGERLYHAVDFYPSAQYVETLRNTAPASLFEKASGSYSARS